MSPVEGSATAGHRNQVPRAKPRERPEPRARGARPLGLTSVRASRRQRDRDVRERFGSAGDPGVEVAEPDLRRHVRDRLAGRCAGAVHRVGRNLFWQSDAEAHLAREVRSVDRRHHLPHHDRADRGRIHLRALEELADAGLAQLDRTQVPKRGPRACEWRAASSNDGDSAFGHEGLGGCRRAARRCDVGYAYARHNDFMLAHAKGCDQCSVQDMTARHRADNSLSHLASGLESPSRVRRVPGRERIRLSRGGRPHDPPSPLALARAARRRPGRERPRPRPLRPLPRPRARPSPSPLRSPRPAPTASASRSTSPGSWWTTGIP